MIKCIIIEDEEPAQKLIIEYLKPHSDFEIISVCNNGFDAFKQINSNNPDVIFLDVQMPKLTGIEMLELIDNPPMLVFTTAYEQYAIKAFEYSATDYLLKPFTQDRFNEAIERVRAAKDSRYNEVEKLNKLIDEIRHENGGIDRVVVKSGNKIKILSLDDIICFEAADDYVIIHSTSDQYLKQTTMREFETHLPTNMFMRVHRSYIINLSYIELIEPYTKDTHIIKLAKGIEVKTSRSGSQSLRKVLNI
jgi:two-component system, LytTR family, response regulator